MLTCNPAAAEGAALGRKKSRPEWQNIDSTEMPSPNPHPTSNPSPSPSPNPNSGLVPVRINLHELKARILKRVGADKANQYFGYVRSFLGLQLTNPELEKLVVSCIGKENVALHNQLVRAVLLNAARSEAPPPPSPPPPPPPPDSAQVMPKPATEICRTAAAVATAAVDNDSSLEQSNAECFDSSLRKGMELDSGGGDCVSPDLSRPSQATPGAAELRLDSEPKGNSNMPPVKRMKIPVQDETETEFSLDSDAGDDLVQDLQTARRFTMPPLGIPFCPRSVGSARKPPSPLAGMHHPIRFLLVGGSEEELQEEDDAFGLPSVDMLQRRMESIVATEGLQGVSQDCAALLKQSIDAFLKRLIKPCTDIASSRLDRLTCEDEGRVKREQVAKLHCGLNGTANNSFTTLQSMGSRTAPNASQRERHRPRSAISMLDLKVAVELNPQLLGEDRALQLERIAFRLSEH